MSQQASPSTGRRYGMQRACRVWEIARSTVYSQRQRRQEAKPPGKRGPKETCLSDVELLEAIRTDLAATPWQGEGHRKVWARLRHNGVRSSQRRVLRLMRENQLLAPTRAGRPHGPAAHDRTIIPERPDVMWGIDGTTVLTRLQGTATIFIAVDHATAECVGIHAANPGTRFEALEPLRQGIRDHYGAYGSGVACGLALRHDHGSVFMSALFQDELRFLGIESSPAFVREPEGNGCAERFIRTLKEQLLWLAPFDTVEELRRALLNFQSRYNREWLIERHGFLSPRAAREQLLAGLKHAA